MSNHRAVGVVWEREKEVEAKMDRQFCCKLGKLPDFRLADAFRAKLQVVIATLSVELLGVKNVAIMHGRTTTPVS